MTDETAASDPSIKQKYSSVSGAYLERIESFHVGFISIVMGHSDDGTCNDSGRLVGFSAGLLPPVDSVLVCIQVNVSSVPHGDSLNADVSRLLALDVADHIDPGADIHFRPFHGLEYVFNVYTSGL